MRPKHTQNPDLTRKFPENPAQYTLESGKNFISTTGTGPGKTETAHLPEITQKQKKKTYKKNITNLWKSKT